jgi:hypothetical protein
VEADEPQLSPIDQVYDRTVAEEKLKHGTKYERLTALVFRALDADTTVTHDVKLRGDGKRTVHQIDVLVSNEETSRRTIIECRDKSEGNKVGLDEARSFASVVRQLEADGVMVTTTGFTAPAVSFAEDENIALMSMRAFSEQDLTGRVMSIDLAISVVVPMIDAVRATPAEGQDDGTVAIVLEAAVVEGATEPTLRHIVNSMMAVPLDDRASGARVARREFDPPLVVQTAETSMSFEALEIEYHLDVATSKVAVDAGSKVAQLVLRSLDGTFDRVIWDTQLRALGFDPKTGEVVAAHI